MDERAIAPRKTRGIRVVPGRVRNSEIADSPRVAWEIEARQFPAPKLVIRK